MKNSNLTRFFLLTFTFVKNSYIPNNKSRDYYEGLCTTLSESAVYPQQVTPFYQRELPDHQSFIPAYYPFSINLNNDLIQHDRQQITSFNEFNEIRNGSKPRLYQRKSSRNSQGLTDTIPKKSESTLTDVEELDFKDTTEKDLSQNRSHSYFHKHEFYTEDQEKIAFQKLLFSQDLEKSKTALDVCPREFLYKDNTNLRYDDKLPKEYNKNSKRNQSTHLQSGSETLNTQLLSPSYVMTTIDSPHMASNLGRENYKYSTTNDEFCNHGISLDSKETSNLVERIDKLSLLQSNPEQIYLHSVPEECFKYNCRKIGSVLSQCLKNQPEQQSNGNDASRINFKLNTNILKNLQKLDPDTEIQKPIYSKPLSKLVRLKNLLFKIISHQPKYALNDIPSREIILKIISIIDDGSLNCYNRVLFVILLSYTQKGFKNYRDSIIKERIINLLTNCDKKDLYSTLSIKCAMFLFKGLNLRYYSIKEGYDILIENFTKLYLKRDLPNAEIYLLRFKRHSFYCLNLVLNSSNFSK